MTNESETIWWDFVQRGHEPKRGGMWWCTRQKKQLNWVVWKSPARSAWSRQQKEERQETTKISDNQSKNAPCQNEAICQANNAIYHNKATHPRQSSRSRDKICQNKAAAWNENLASSKYQLLIGVSPAMPILRQAVVSKQSQSGTMGDTICWIDATMTCEMSWRYPGNSTKV